MAAVLGGAGAAGGSNFGVSGSATGGAGAAGGSNFGLSGDASGGAGTGIGGTCYRWFCM